MDGALRYRACFRGRFVGSNEINNLARCLETVMLRRNINFVGTFRLRFWG